MRRKGSVAKKRTRVKTVRDIKAVFIIFYIYMEANSRRANLIKEVKLSS